MKKEKKAPNAKAIRITAIITVCFLSVCMVFIVAILTNAAVYKDYGLEETLICDEFFSEWQSTISDSAKLNEVVTVGSHDSGSIDMMKLAKTQGHSIYDQLRGGVRYFDLRVKQKGGELVIYHSLITGQKFSTVLDEINRFLGEHPSEFLILDFQHIGVGVRKQVISAIEKGLDMSKAMKRSQFAKIEETTMQDVRDSGCNYAIVWKKASDTKDRDFLYGRKKYLISSYDKIYHTKFNCDRLIEHYDKYFDEYEGEGFFVLQAQRTAPTLFNNPAELELEFKPKINAFIASLAQSDKLAKTNIIMRDFVVSDMTNVKTILALNLAKGIVNAADIARYTAAVGL